MVVAECGTGKTLISLGGIHVHSAEKPCETPLRKGSEYVGIITKADHDGGAAKELLISKLLTALGNRVSQPRNPSSYVG